MKNILFVCTGNSHRSIIAESIINNNHSDKFKAYSAGSNPSGTVDKDVLKFLEEKNYDLKSLSSKNFDIFIKSLFRFFYFYTFYTSQRILNYICYISFQSCLQNLLNI